MIHSRDDALVTAYLDQPVVDARLELTSVLGGSRLAELRPRAGTVRWDGSQRRGRLDLDVVTEDVMHARHPLANLGQVLVARWVWPEIGIEVPCGRWLISEPGERQGRLWQVWADPEGPARLDRATWWTPGGRVVTGTLARQVGIITAEARVGWVPSGAFDDQGVPATDCATGDTVLSSLQKVLDHAETDMWAARSGAGVVLSRNRGRRPDWTWSDESPQVFRVGGAHASGEVPNRVTVWCETEANGVRKAKGWSEPLMHGPRRWDGPYGRVPVSIRLDEEASQASMRAQAIRELRAAQAHAATVTVEMRADPRVECGDIAQVRSPDAGTDCLARVSAVELDAGTGAATVQCAAISGVVGGTPLSYHEL